MCTILIAADPFSSRCYYGYVGKAQDEKRHSSSFFATIPSQVSQLWLKKPYKRPGICLRLMRTARPTASHNHLPSGELSATMPLPLTKLITAALSREKPRRVAIPGCLTELAVVGSDKSQQERTYSHTEEVIILTSHLHFYE